MTYDPSDTNENDNTADGDVTFQAVNTEHAGNVTLASGYDSLQTAIDQSNEGIVVVDGDFEYEPPLTISDGVSLWGQAQRASGSRGSLLKPATSGADTGIIVDGPASGTPSNTTLTNLHLRANGATDIMEVTSTCRSPRFNNCYIFGGDYGFNFYGGSSARVIGCEFGQQDGAGIRVTGKNSRDITVRDCGFEGFISGHVEFNGQQYTGEYRFLNCRFSYANVTDGFGFDLNIGDATREFKIVVDNCKFSQFKSEVPAINIRGSSPIGGPIKISNNTFIGNNRDDNTATGERAIQCQGKVRDSLQVTGNTVRYFATPASQPFNVKNSQETLTAYGNDGQNGNGEVVNGILSRSGEAIFSGDGSQTTFPVDHNMQGGHPPSIVTATPDLSTDAVGIKGVKNIDTNYFDVEFESAPASGTDNVRIMWNADYV